MLRSVLTGLKTGRLGIALCLDWLQNGRMNESKQSLNSKHIALSGAGTGIGRAIAERLAKEGAKLSLFGRNLDRLTETKSLLGDAEVSVSSCDIRDRAAVDACFAKFVEAQGPLYALVANSGIGGPNESGSEDRFDDLVATNLTGTYSCLRAAERHLVDSNGGADTRHLVVISSILARIGVPGYTGYCASKAALLGLVRALSAELAPDQVQVNAICPGWVDTEMAHEGLRGMAGAMGVTKDEAHAIAMQAVPLGRMSQPGDIAGMVAWLLSQDSRGVTGQALDMNGGAFMS